MTVYRNRLDEALATLAGGLGMFLLFGFPFIILGTISSIGWLTRGPFEPFALSNVIPKFMTAAATNLAITFMCAAALVLLVTAITWRYLHHRKTIEFLRSKGVTDFDGDGRTDNFSSKFLDDL